jgi:hypothetical protein
MKFKPDKFFTFALSHLLQIFRRTQKNRALNTGRKSWMTGRLAALPRLASMKKLNTDPMYFFKSRDSSVGIALGYGLDDRGSRVRFPAEAGNYTLHHRVQNVSGAHPASYPMGTRGSFPGDKAAGA